MSDTYDNKIKIKGDFYNMLSESIRKSGGEKSAKTSQGHIDVTEIPIENFSTDIIKPYIRPGAVVDPKSRHITLEEAHVIGRVTDIKNHSLDAWDNRIKASREVPEYDIDYARKPRDVYEMKQIQHMFLDDAGNTIKLFGFFNNPKGKTVFKQEYAARYLRNLYSMFKEDRLDPGWEARWEKDYKASRGRFLTPDARIRLDIRNEAYKAYKDYNKDEYDLGSKDIVDRVGAVLGYFSKKNIQNIERGPQKGYVPWKKPDAEYSQ